MKHVFLFFCSLLVFPGCKNQDKNKSPDNQTSSALSVDSFVKVDSVNPILVPSSGAVFNCPVSNKLVNWEEKNVLNPAAVVREGKVFLLYRAQDSAMTSRLGVAVSEDGLHFTKMPEPVFFPREDSMKKYEWPGGVEDPRIVTSPGGEYILTYTAYNGKTARLCIATSPDLLHWKKWGPVLKDDKYIDSWSKSGAILVQQKDHEMVAVKVGGKYWMYFGDTNIFLAYSDDLINWTVAENAESKKMVEVLHPRYGYFDSRLVEPGPYALLQDDGILLIYNGSNASNFNDSNFPEFTYSAGYALFDKERPYKLIARSDSGFIRPDKSYERTGEVNEVCFVEGLVWFKNKWLLYYGTADSRIAVAVSK